MAAHRQHNTARCTTGLRSFDTPAAQAAQEEQFSGKPRKDDINRVP
jgi:hypothetical protein